MAGSSVGCPAQILNHKAKNSEGVGPGDGAQLVGPCLAWEALGSILGM